MTIATTPTQTAQEFFNNFNSISMLSEQAKIVLEHRYFLKDQDNTIIEDGNELFSRVAKDFPKYNASIKLRSFPTIPLISYSRNIVLLKVWLCIKRF